MVYLHSPRVFQSLMVLSRDPETMAVVGREGDREDIFVVSDEAAGGEAGVQVPQAEGAVPRAGEGELTVGGDDDILNEVPVATEGL